MYEYRLTSSYLLYRYCIIRSSSHFIYFILFYFKNKQSLEIEAIICPTDAVTLKCEDTETIQKHCQSLLNLSEDEASEWLKADIEQGTNAYYGCIVYTAEHIFEPENYVGCCNRSHCEDWTDMFSMGEHDDDDDDHFDDDFDMNIRDPEPEQADEL